MTLLRYISPAPNKLVNNHEFKQKAPQGALSHVSGIRVSLIVVVDIRLGVVVISLACVGGLVG